MALSNRTRQSITIMPIIDHDYLLQISFYIAISTPLGVIKENQQKSMSYLTHCNRINKRQREN